jgi:hypothetical protein
LEWIDKSQLRITSPHYSKVSALPSQRLPISRKSLMYMFSTPYCSTSACFSSPRMMKSSLGFSSNISSTISSKLFERNLGPCTGCASYAGTKYVLSCLNKFIGSLLNNYANNLTSLPACSLEENYAGISRSGCE